MNSRNFFGFACFLLVCLVCLWEPGMAAQRAAGAAKGATITFQKTFKSSYPEFVEIRVSETGAGTFDIRQLDEDANPQPLSLGAPLTQRIFQLAASLHDFQGVDIDVHRRIANLGQKILRYEKDGDAHEVTFNYTLNDSASQLVDIFEGIARQEGDLSDLQRTMRYDRLGVNDVITQVENDYNKKLLPEPDQLLPTLDQIAADAKIIDMARDRARTLASRIRTSR
jgi:hypothetical protein